ncbi:MAG: molybdopterin-dependent oxidoreductase [Mucilaginibacter sp.]
MKKIINSIILLILLSAPFLSSAQNKEAIVKVTGEVSTPLNITVAEYEKYKQVTVNRKDKEGKEHVYKGVLLGDILQKAGATLGENLKGENLTKFVLAEASDGYKATFALTELDKAFTDRAIILTNNVDGKPLPTTEGPFRIIIQDEKKPSRCVRQLISLRVGFAK